MLFVKNMMFLDGAIARARARPRHPRGDPAGAHRDRARHGDAARARAGRRSRARDRVRHGRDQGRDGRPATSSASPTARCRSAASSSEAGSSSSRGQKSRERAVEFARMTTFDRDEVESRVPQLLAARRGRRGLGRVVRRVLHRRRHLHRARPRQRERPRSGARVDQADDGGVRRRSTRCTSGTWSATTGASSSTCRTAATIPTRASRRSTSRGITVLQYAGDGRFSSRRRLLVAARRHRDDEAFGRPRTATSTPSSSRSARAATGATVPRGRSVRRRTSRVGAPGERADAASQRRGGFPSLATLRAR